MSGLYGRPTAAELVAAVADFLDNDVRAATGPDSRLADAGQVNFHARVAANVLRIVERELLDAVDRRGHRRAAASASRRSGAWPRAIRAGESTTGADDVMACLRTVVRRRFDVAHPGYASDPTANVSLCTRFL